MMSGERDRIHDASVFGFGVRSPCVLKFISVSIQCDSKNDVILWSSEFADAKVVPAW